MNIHKKALSLLLSIALIYSVFSLDTTAAWAAVSDSGSKNSGFGTMRNGAPVTLYLDSGDIVITDSGYSVGGSIAQYSSGYRIMQNGNGEVQHTVTVQSGTQDITIQNVNIDVSRTDNACAFSIAKGAAVSLTLAGTNTLKSGDHRAGLEAPGDGSNPPSQNGNAFLTVTAQSTGLLTATGGRLGAGIGGYNPRAGGIITINGGTVKAYGGYNGAGIGGAVDGVGGIITISGGTVTATGGNLGAGIGGGYVADSGGIIKISGGTVKATGGAGESGISGGAGIGGTSGGTVAISGPDTQVTAKGKDGGKDIGSGGNDGTILNTTGGTLTVGGGNTLEPLPILELLSAGTNAANANNNRPQFMNCVIQGIGAKDANNSDISGCYDANGKIRLSVIMPTPASVEVDKQVALNASVTKYNPDVQNYQFSDPTFLPGAIQFYGNSVPLGSHVPIAADGSAQAYWTPLSGAAVSLKAAYVPAANDCYAPSESTPFDYTPGKITPVVSANPTASAVTAGSPLSASTLSGGAATVPGSFSWENRNETVTASGRYAAVFTPYDTTDYNTDSGIMVWVTVTASSSDNHSSNISAPSLPAELTDVPTGTAVDLSGAAFPSSVTSLTLSVTPVRPNSTADPNGAAVYGKAGADAKLNAIGTPAVYNIKLLDQSGNPVSFTGSIAVRIPLPSGINGTPRVFRYEESTGTLTDLGAAVQDGYLVFSTTHFSYYVIAGTGDSITLDTKSYQMPVNGQYQIGMRLTGSKAASVKVYSTDNKTATVTKLKSGNYQVNGKSTGTVWIVFDVYDGKNKLLTHVSTRVDVKTGIRPKGDSTRQISVF